MNKKYIDLTNFQIIEKPNFFEVDSKMAETISILNRKGYKTIFCCSGHLAKDYQKLTSDIKFLEQAIKDWRIYVTEIRKNDFDYFSEPEFIKIYIGFKEHYDFAFLPPQFTYRTKEENFSCGDIIELNIKLFRYKQKINDMEIAKKINVANKVLYNWAKKLPDKN